MVVDFIYDSDCPNVQTTRTRLLEAFSMAGVQARWSEYDSAGADLPDYARGFGSPTVLVNGRDVYGELPGEGSCCRVYRDGAGNVEGTPAVARISEALRGPAASCASSSPRERATTARSTFAVVPAIGAALLPKITCPLCWPAYTGALSVLGLGFLMETHWLLPLTSGFLAIALGALLFRARQRKGYGPFCLGLVAAAALLIGKFAFDHELSMYIGACILFVASIWNAWPARSKTTSCSACVNA